MTAWESRILDDLVRNPDDVFVVTVHSSKVVRLWGLMQTEMPEQTAFLIWSEFRDNVFCDCIAERIHTEIPVGAKRVYLHTKEIYWDRIAKPTHAEILTES